MTVAQHDTASLTINIDNSSSLNQSRLWQPVQLSTAFINKIWWHTHAYSTVFSIVLLALVSFIFLSLHWSFRKIAVLTKADTVSEHEITS
ncbi:hypothetical protein [Nostoc sp. MS1]|uniref:hypothetical protein n=1 Tax=Nostoc sp. MS1 TaxID=2764711 RepID=UPI001CC72B2C|nr:hypothetical protein [Nostoc sp. MS1]BCL37139.1 hypothetical protein NSMS1_35860 [Nostoc sp. MS1]